MELFSVQNPFAFVGHYFVMAESADVAAQKVAERIVAQYHKSIEEGKEYGITVLPVVFDEDGINETWRVQE